MINRVAKVFHIRIPFFQVLPRTLAAMCISDCSALLSCKILFGMGSTSAFSKSKIWDIADGAYGHSGFSQGQVTCRGEGELPDMTKE